MQSRFTISLFLMVGVSRLLLAPPAEYSVEEQGNNLILVTPDGRRILWGDHNLPSEKSYQFEIPLSELSDDAVKKAPADRAPASIPQPTSSPAPFYDVDWDWDEPDEDVVAAPSPTPTPVVVASPPPTPKVEYDGSDSLILKANRLFHKGKYYEAALYVDEVLRRNPENMRAWLMKGSALYKLGQKDLAQKAWKQATALDTEQKETKGLMERYK